jgi:hypothetical protein
MLPDDQYNPRYHYIATDECGNASVPSHGNDYCHDVAPTWDQMQPGDLDIMEV